MAGPRASPVSIDPHPLPPWRCEFTESSKAQRDGLAAGKFQIAQGAIDNAVAMIEVAKQDVVIVSGGDSGMNEFYVQPGINVEGKTGDAPPERHLDLGHYERAMMLVGR